MKGRDSNEIVDVERRGDSEKALLQKHEAGVTITELTNEPKKRPTRLIFWIIINVLATIAIVFVNKAIFDDPSLRKCQLLFASFHFFITWGTLQICSTSAIGLFERKETGIMDVMPIALAMCMNVVLPNLSLAYSSVTFYQTVRVLLTPLTAFFNFFLYNISITRKAALTLVPVCFGVAFLTYSDVKPVENVKTTSFFGVFFAMSGVLASSIYTIWIAHFRKKLELTSVQLLHKQALVGAVMLLYFVPWIDQLPIWRNVSQRHWAMIMLSGGCACLINLSQFVIVAGAGPVASTVVGHSKTVTIVAIGWIISGRSVGDGSIFGIVTAIGGVILYSIAAMEDKGGPK